MASSVIFLADVSPAAQLGSTYGVFLVSVIIAAGLFGVTVLQSLYYYAQFPKDKLVLKATIGVIWALDAFSIFLNTHAAYFYLISNFTNISALNEEVWSVQVELLVTYTVVLVVQIFFILRMYHLRPNLWYIPVFFGLCAIASYASLIAIFVRVHKDTTWSETASSDVIRPLVANWVMGNIVDIGITVVLCWYLWSEKVGVPHRTDVMLNRIIVFLVNRGAIAAVVQVLTLLTKFMFPQTFVWLAFHNILSKVYVNSMLATLNARVGFRKIIMDYQLDQTKPPTEFSVKPGRPIRKVPPLSESHQISTVEFVEEPVYPPATLDQRSQVQRSAYAAYAAYDSRSTSIGTGSGVTYDQRSGLASFHQRAVAYDQSSVPTELDLDSAYYPPHVNRATSAGSRYARTTLSTSRDDEPTNPKRPNMF